MHYVLNIHSENREHQYYCNLQSNCREVEPKFSFYINNTLQAHTWISMLAFDLITNDDLFIHDL